MASQSNSSEQLISLDDALDIASRLSNRDKLHLITELSTQLERNPLFERKSAARAERSLLGALAHCGPAPSTEDIDEARDEMLANFPREELTT